MVSEGCCPTVHHPVKAPLIMGPCLNSWSYSVSRINWLFPVTGQLCEKRDLVPQQVKRYDIDLGLEEDVLEDVMESERKARGRRPFLCGGEKVNDTSA